MIFTGVRHQGGIHSKPLPWDKAMEIYSILMEDPEKDYRRLFAYAFGLFTGARAGEIAKITWGSIHGVNETALGRTDLRIMFESSKGSDTRVPHLAPELIAAIVRVKKWAGAEVQKSNMPVILKSKIRRTANNRDAATLVNSALIIGGIFDTSGCHTLRKTLGRKMYEINGKSDEALHFCQKFLGHRSKESTMHYIGITDERLKETIQNLNAKGVEVGPQSFYNQLDWFEKRIGRYLNPGGDEDAGVLDLSRPRLYTNQEESSVGDHP